MRVVINGEARELAPGSSLLESLTGIGIDPGVVVVERNGAIVPKGEFRGIQLQDGDKLEIVRFVGGG